MNDFDVAIIGGGPAGLTAALEASKAGLKPLVLERSSCVGGIARTVNYKGYRFDIGGRRFFTKVQRVNALWDEILGDELTEPGRHELAGRPADLSPMSCWHVFPSPGSACLYTMSCWPVLQQRLQ